MTRVSTSHLSRDQLVSLFEQTHGGFAELSLNGRFTAVNDQFCNMVGRSREELVGMRILDVTHPDDVDSNIAMFERMVDCGEPYELTKRYLRPDGSPVWVRNRVSLFRTEEGQPQSAFVVSVDVTEGKLAQRAAEEQSRMLETLNRTGAAVAAELDLQKVVQMVTDAGVELTGAQFGAFFYNVLNDAGESYMLYSLSGARRDQFDFGMPRNTAVFHPTFSGEGIIRVDDITSDPRYGQMAPHFGMPEGHLPVRSYLAVPVISRSGEVIGGLFFGHSEPGRFEERHEQLMIGIAAQAAISIDNARLYQAVQRAKETLEQRVAERSAELEQANEALRQAQKMEAIGQLTGGIAHDFNNMLTVIRGSTDVLRRPDLEPAKKERYLEAIAETADRAARLTGQLLAFARRQALKPEVFEAAQRVRGIEDMLRTMLTSRISLVIEGEDKNCFVEADVSQFETALVNMAANARDAMNGEGELAIRVARYDGVPPGTPDREGGQFVAVTVADTGEGIAPHDLEKIFEPFFTTKEVGKGTGLGLSQVYGFAKQSGGEIAVESEPGKGAAFTLYLPLSAPPKQQLARRGAECQRLNGAGRVLVVEDNQEVGRFAEQVLADLGFQATLAGNGNEALQLLNSGAQFDVVFSDVVMPGINGIDFAQQVRASAPELPIILTSGYSHVLAQGPAHGFPLLHKPYSVDALAAALAQALQR